MAKIGVDESHVLLITPTDGLPVEGPESDEELTKQIETSKPSLQ